MTTRPGKPIKTPTSKVLVVAPHPDDETLGCAGTLLRRAAQGTQLGWLIATGMTDRYSDKQRQNRADTIAKVTAAYGFDPVYCLDLPTTELDSHPLSKIIDAISGAINDFQPDELLLPHRGDVHSDHRIIFDACAACSKWFRYPFIKRIMSYETLSETDFSLASEDKFHPNVFFDISDHLQRKLDIMAMYSDECGSFPFPRSAEAITAQARVRGTQSGYQAAEAFMLLRERND